MNINLERIKFIKLNYILILLFFLASLLIFYSGIGKVYFQQDEWYSLGKIIYHIKENQLGIFTQRFAFHYVPLTSVYFTLQYLIFGLSNYSYLYFGIILQAIAGLSLYLVLKRLFGNTPLSLVLSLMFVLNGEIYQVILNEVVSFYTLSLIIVNLLLIKFYDYITKQKDISTTQIIFLISLIILSIFTHEAWLTLSIIIPIFFIFFKAKKFKPGTRKIAIFGIIFASIVALRLLLEVVLPFDSLRPQQVSNKVAIPYNSLTLPFKASAQYLIGLNNINDISKLYESKVSYFRDDKSINQDLMAITLVYDTIVFYLSSIILVIIIILLFVLRINLDINNKYFKVFLFGAVWIGSISLIFSPQSRLFTSIESRYIYFFAEGIILIVGGFSLMMWEKIKNFNLLRIPVLVFALFLFTISIFSYYHQISLFKNSLIEVSNIRSGIINQIKILYPNTPQRTIFYLRCEDMCVGNEKLGMPREWIVPFQEGFGWTLMVIYSEETHKYSKFFSKEFLWELMSTGYEEHGSTGFGYFTNVKDLKNAMKKYKLKPQDIIALEYNSSANSVNRISDKEKQFILR